MRNISIDGHEAVDQLRQFQFVFVEQAGDRSAGLQQLEDLVAHRGVVAAQHGRPARLQKVDVAVAVHVPQVRAVRFLDGQREGIVEGQVVLHAAGDVLLGLVGQRLGAGAVGLEVVQELLHLLAPDGAQRLADEFLQAGVDLVGVVPFGDGVGLSVGHGTSY